MALHPLWPSDNMWRQKVLIIIGSVSAKSQPKSILIWKWGSDETQLSNISTKIITFFRGNYDGQKFCSGVPCVNGVAFIYRPYEMEDLDGEEYDDDEDEDRSRESSANRDSYKPEMTEERRAKLREIEVNQWLKKFNYTETNLCYCKADQYDMVLIDQSLNSQNKMKFTMLQWHFIALLSFLCHTPERNFTG